MKKLSVALLIIILCSFGSSEAQRSKDPNVHFQQIQVTLGPQDTLPIFIPRPDVPVRVDVSVAKIQVSQPIPDRNFRPVILTGLVIQDSTSGAIYKKSLPREPGTLCDFVPNGIDIDCFSDSLISNDGLHGYFLKVQLFAQNGLLKINTNCTAFGGQFSPLLVTVNMYY